MAAITPVRNGRIRWCINPKANYSKILGRHTLKAGYEYQAIDDDLDDFNPAYGQDIYGGQFTNPTPTKSNTLYNIADFLLGARSTYQLTNFTEAHIEQRMNFAYLQDDFKVSPSADVEPGSALRVRHSRSTNGQPHGQLRSGHKLAGLREQRLDRRPRPGQSQLQELGLRAWDWPTA